MNDILIMIVSFVILILSIVIHEVSHGTMAYYLGDETAKRQGRLSLNPIKHIDPIGTILLPLVLVAFSSPVVIGWAKPVPVNFMNLTDKRWGALKVSLAGPLSNIVVAILCGLVVRFFVLPEGMVLILGLAVIYNLLLAIFNLIPIPPLDGSHILFSFVNIDYKVKAFLYQWGSFILIFILFFTPFLNWIFNLVGILAYNLTGVLFL